MNGTKTWRPRCRNTWHQRRRNSLKSCCVRPSCAPRWAATIVWSPSRASASSTIESTPGSSLISPLKKWSAMLKYLAVYRDRASYFTFCCVILYCDDAVLCCAVLCCAVLCCAVLCCAVLCCAVLCCAVLCCAVLCCAVLCCAVLCCAVLCWALLCLVSRVLGLPGLVGSARATRGG